MQLKNKKDIRRLIVLFTLAYTVSYITRINYGAVITEMENSTAFSRSLLSMAVTGSFVTYGLGQIVSGILGDHISPKKLVSYGFILTTVMNLLIPLCGDPYQMLAVRCVNGFAQSLMWPPLVRLMTALLSDEDYKKATTTVVCGSSVGTILVYLLSPVLISLASWRAVFFFSAICGGAMLLIWNVCAQDVPPQKRAVSVEKTKGANEAFLTPAMIGMMLAIVCLGMLRDGVTTWTPSYISETYDLSSVVAILSGVILPLFGMICMRLSLRIYEKRFTNPVLCGGVFFGICTVSTVMLYLLSGRNAALSVILSAILTGCMHGANLTLVCMTPAYFKRYGNVGTASGVINSCVYVGAAGSTYGIALLSEQQGWSLTLLTWVVIGLLGTVLCLISARPWQKQFADEPLE